MEILIPICILICVMLTIILTCEAILKHNKTNGVSQDIFPSTFTPNYVNIVTHILHKGNVIQNFTKQVHEYDAKYVALDNIHKGKRYYKAYKHRNKS